MLLSVLTSRAKEYITLVEHYDEHRDIVLCVHISSYLSIIIRNVLFRYDERKKEMSAPTAV